MRGLGWIEELDLQRVRFVFGTDGDESVENAFQGLGRSRPDPGKGLAMNRQFAEQVTYRVTAEIGVGQSRIAANRKRRDVGWRQPQAGLI